MRPFVAFNVTHMPGAYDQATTARKIPVYTSIQVRWTVARRLCFISVALGSHTHKATRRRTFSAACSKYFQAIQIGILQLSVRTHCGMASSAHALLNADVFTVHNLHRAP